jgi:hypothetical protein
MMANTPDRKLQRSESLFDPPKVSDLVIKKNQAEFQPDSSIYLRERGNLKYMVQSGQVQEAKAYLSDNFKDFYENNINTRALLDAL